MNYKPLSDLKFVAIATGGTDETYRVCAKDLIEALTKEYPYRSI